MDEQYHDEPDDDTTHTPDTSHTTSYTTYHDHAPSQLEDGLQAVPEASIADSSDLRIRSVSPAPDDGPAILPVWLRQSSSSFGRRSWLPLPLRSAARFVRDWTKGPKIAQIQRIRPWFPVAQEAPLRLVRTLLPTKARKATALLAVYAAWLATFCLVLQRTAESGFVEGYGVPASLWCGANFWSAGNDCGLDGNNCRPFANASLAFRCNANCAGMKISNPYPVGDQVLNYEPLVVGGSEEGSGDGDDDGAFYRADSFICQAAVHAGVVADDAGGCGVLHLTGARSNYPASYRNGVRSHSFDSSFPKSYSFDRTVAAECGVVDMRWPLLAVTVLFTSLISLFVASPAVFFASVFTMLFLHVGLVSDRPNVSSYDDLVSLVVGRFLPAALAAAVVYRSCVRPQLAGLTAQVEKTVLWLGGAWVGSLSNYTLDFIPIQRLTPHDIRAQPGAVLALVAIVALISAVAVGQVHYLRLEGRLRRYLAVYAAMAAALLVCVALPGLHLRIHHYLLALLLLPGTRPQTRPGLLYQGLLLGLFVNGTARWGFDSLLQTADALRGGGEPVGSLLPKITAIATTTTTTVLAAASAANITFRWPSLPPPGYDGLSVLVNDVERHRWYADEGAAAAWTWSWTGGGEEEDREGGQQQQVQQQYFRFAYMSGSAAADYTRAGVWAADGSWRHMEQEPVA